ncbi:cytochrome b-c1 complex subunit Rieske, mitochondrial-like [Acanthaster planci]|uniref:Cytochrome b-c1 complex subunit Rieske, mitochondrial n=1 Tax=Acanthaster planci TaxID=133434 RepID=A0A8B7Z5K4_ACAPL|nr:cytochrome b-c1 complex subunit Rieske, mitochondrial-like [Acanthaster planci]
MLAAGTKIGAFAPFISATSQNVASQLRPAVVVVPSLVPTFKIPSDIAKHTNEAMSTFRPRSTLKVTSGVQGPSYVRYAHTDIQVPDFSEYRHADTQDPNKPAHQKSVDRKAYSYMMVGAGGIAAAYVAKTLVTEFVSTMSASADVLAMAKIEIKLSEIPEGKNMTFKWRGKPLFVRHRTQAEIDDVTSVDVSSLRHQQHDNERVKDPEWLILIGVCTHLGCVPIANAGDFGGYYCPCHGSHYDASGRIRKGPAPENLEVPEYVFNGDELVVG